MSPLSGSAVVEATCHPLQRVGALAVAGLAGRGRPEQVERADLDHVADKITGDAAAAATAPKNSAGYDWWKVLFALYPNAKPTHAKRPKDAEKLRGEMAAMFAVDGGSGPAQPCTFCGVPCTVLWAKAELPMFDSVRALNTLPPGLAGWPVCRACRVAMWALPYGAWVSAGSAAVLTSDNTQVERAFVLRNIRRAERIRQLGFRSLAAGRGPEAAAVQALRRDVAGEAAAATLWLFKNDNHEPWLRVSGTRIGTARFLERLPTEREYRAGWWALRRRMQRRDPAGNIAVHGATAAARLLFDPDLAPADRLLRELRRRGDPDRVATETLLQWRRLAALYLEVMYDVDTRELAPVAEMLAQWIKNDSSRGRFNEYRTAADSGYLLRKVLMTASGRLTLDSGRACAVPTEVVTRLTSGGAPAGHLRCQLWFEVLAELHRRDVPLGRGDEEDDGDEEPMRQDDADPLSEEGEEG